MAKASLAEAMAALGSEVKAGESPSLPEDPMVRRVRDPVEWYLPCHCLRLGIYLWAEKQARLLEIYRRQSQSVFYLWVRQHLPWWKSWAPKAVLHLIEAGLENPTSLVDRLSCLIQDKSKEDLLAANSILQEYLQVGAVTIKTLRSLVHYQEKRWRKGEVAFDCRLPRNKCIFFRKVTSS